MVLVLIIIGILGGCGFWKLIQHYNYEMNFKESLLFSFDILILTFITLIDYSLITIYVGWEIFIYIVIYFLILLLFYYIIRSIKLKKYIPTKTIIGYILISVIDLIILFNILEQSISNIDGWAVLGLYLIYIIFYIVYIVSLIIINIIIFSIKLIKKNNMDYKNIHYKISKFSLINIAIIIFIVGLIFAINMFNEYNYNKEIKHQLEIVNKYLAKKYPNYNFEVIESYEIKPDFCIMMCVTPVYRNEIQNKNFNKNFYIDVKIEDLSIYEDEFKEILEQKKSEEKNIKNYLIENYNISLKYSISEDKMKNVEFIINNQYNKEDINIFVSDMKNVFNYIETNFYDLDYVILNFKNGNPFYEGEYEYSQNNGSIKDNTTTNELWIMINNEYIFIEK